MPASSPPFFPIRLGAGAVSIGAALVVAACQSGAQPEISSMSSGDFPPGCSLTVNSDQKVLVWAPYLPSPPPQSDHLLILVDGKKRQLPIETRDDSRILARDQRYSVDVATPAWKRVDQELWEANASLKVRNLQLGTESELAAKAYRGC